MRGVAGRWQAAASSWQTCACQHRTSGRRRLFGGPTERQTLWPPSTGQPALPGVRSVHCAARAAEAPGKAEGGGVRQSAATGRLELIMGPMFAGKTSALLERIAFHEGLSKSVLAVKSNKDTRYGVGELNTHDGKSRGCYAISSLSQLKEQWPQQYRDAQVIAVDEAQFFPDLREFCCAAADEDMKEVLVAGLDGDFRRERFGQILDLVPHADTITKLVSRCGFCAAENADAPAPFSLRIAADDRQEVVGGAEKYAPACRRHFAALARLRPAGGGAQR